MAARPSTSSRLIGFAREKTVPVAAFAGLMALVSCAGSGSPAPATTVSPAITPDSTPTPSPPPPQPVATPVPLPPAPPAPPHRDPWRANEDPADNFVVGPPELIPDCEERLQQAGVTWRPGSIRVHASANGKYTCGSPQVVIYDKGPTGLRWNAAPVVTCGLAIALARFETIVEEEAELHLGQRVTGVGQGGTYACRKMALYSWVSEHSFANAIDFLRFTLADHSEVNVEKHFGRTDQEPATPPARFLRSLARRLFDEGVFSNVLTPYFDRLHRNHFHVDLARYRVDGTR